MLNLQRYENNGLELVINTETGEAFASISAVARMTDKDTSTINKYVNGAIKGCDEMHLLDAEIATGGGIQGVALLNESQMLKVISRYKPELLIKFAQAGLRMFLHNLAGYKVQSEAVAAPVRQLAAPTTAKEYFELLVNLGFEGDLNMKQLIRDKAEDELSTSLGKALPSAKQPEYTIGKVRATELGYSIKEIGNGSALGKYLAKNVPIAYEQRVGKYAVNHYLVGDVLDTAIRTYFGTRRKWTM
jgi:hypothetical protein